MAALANLNGSAVNGGGSSNGSVNLSTIADNQFYARRKNPPGSRVNVVLGAQWGDEGKGKMVDMLATTADVVCRCQVSATSIFGGLKVSRAPLGPENPPLVGVADLVM